MFEINMKKTGSILVILFLIFTLPLIGPSQIFAAKVKQKENISPLIRVLIIKDTPSFLLTIAGNYKIFDLKDDKLLSEGSYLKKKKASASETGLKIKKKDFVNVKSLKITPQKDGSIYINGRRFRGTVTAYRNENRTLMVINELPLEDYLYGVLYHEISQKWPLETIKAQAIASRTFALYQTWANKDKLYDLTSDIYSQMYGGATSEKGRTNKGVDMTKGKVLTYQGKIFPAYFHATCAGHTEDASQLWNIDIEPLKGVPCDFCKNSPHYKWEKVVDFSEIRDNLKKSGMSVKEVKGISIAERNASGRVSKIIIQTDSEGIPISGKDLRMLIGPNVIRSTNFTIESMFGMVQFTGLGWGHGVGLCQWGACGMAENGYELERIINRYYPGAEISDINEIK